MDLNKEAKRLEEAVVERARWLVANPELDHKHNCYWAVNWTRALEKAARALVPEEWEWEVLGFVGDPNGEDAKFVIWQYNGKA